MTGFPSIYNNWTTTTTKNGSSSYCFLERSFYDICIFVLFSQIYVYFNIIQMHMAAVVKIIGSWDTTNLFIVWKNTENNVAVNILWWDI